MKCPICGSELQQLPKNPKVFYCKKCKKYFKNDLWRSEENSSSESVESSEFIQGQQKQPASKKTNNTKNLIILLCAVGGGILFGIIVFFLGLMITPEVDDSISITTNQSSQNEETVPPETTAEPDSIVSQSDTQSDAQAMTETESIIENDDTDDILTVGDSATQDDITITLLSVHESYGNDYITPDSGKLFLSLEFEIENNSNSDLSISSYWNFEAYCDDYLCEQDLSGLFIDEIQTLGQLDGEIASGKKLKGAITYQVPIDYKTFEINFVPDFWSSQDVKFIINK